VIGSVKLTTDRSRRSAGKLLEKSVRSARSESSQSRHSADSSSHTRRKTPNHVSLRSSSVSSRGRHGVSGSSTTSHSISSSSKSSRSTASNPLADIMPSYLMDSHGLGRGLSSEKEMENRIADIIWGKFKDANSLSSGNSSSLGPPQDKATIVLTDVQGSTSLWEANPQAMQESLDIHDRILRRNCAFHNGYEIDTEGDAFFLAFHNPIDAFGFALKTQCDLYDTEWPSGILAIPAAAKEGCFCGLRVRMGIHQGHVESCRNEVTERTEYVGEAMNIAKCVEGMTHGGQILTTFQTWNVASYKAESVLDSPQVLDLGSYTLKPKGSDESPEFRIIQLVHSRLSFDYFAARRKPDSDSMLPLPSQGGRQFDAPITEGQLTASFHDAPHDNFEVTIAFVYFSQIENEIDDAKPIISELVKLVGELLVGTPGYQSQSNMLAFPDINEAVEFGLLLLDELKEKRVSAGGQIYTDLSKMVRFGCVHGTFLSMGPHRTTGRADYFGKIVNRAARITGKSELGTVNFGVIAEKEGAKLPQLKDKFVCKFKGTKQLKGVPEDMDLYEVTLDTGGNLPLGLSTNRGNLLAVEN